jgi:trehalose synthase
MTEVTTTVQPIRRFVPIVGAKDVSGAEDEAAALRACLAGRTVWNINSTAVGGGVAEMLRPLLGYARGVGIDARWFVLEGTPDFFRVTKRLHHALHGSRGDRTPLDDRARTIYDATMLRNAAEMARAVRPRDVVILHDPQTAGLAPYLIRAGTCVIWRCHIGHDTTDNEVEGGWAFLAPYLADVPAFVFSRRAYVPECCDHGKSTIITPSIDAFSVKNQELRAAAVRSILVQAGLVAGPTGSEPPAFLREDGSLEHVRRPAEVIRDGSAPTWETPLVVQVSRWDPLKDPVGVLQGFATLVNGGGATDAGLVLAGPDVRAVGDDPEGSDVFAQVVTAWRQMPAALRRRVHLASLPMADVDENAAIVNALQRHAAVVVQKSLHEGFGLTITEAMWKARPIVASAVGGIQDQIADGVHGLLLETPTDLDAFAAAVLRLLENPHYAETLGRNARARVGEEFLGIHHLLKYAQLIARLDGAYEAAGCPDSFTAAMVDRSTR